MEQFNYTKYEQEIKRMQAKYKVLPVYRNMVGVPFLSVDIVTVKGRKVLTMHLKMVTFRENDILQSQAYI